MKNVRVGIGQQIHRFSSPESSKPCVIAGVSFDLPGFQANSDGDVIYQAICNALSSLTGVQVLNEIGKQLRLEQGITDSGVYLQHAKELLHNKSTISHVAISIEAKRPQLKEHIDTMRINIAAILNLTIDQVGITVVSGDGLSDVACGEGIACTAIVTLVDIA